MKTDAQATNAPAPAKKFKTATGKPVAHYTMLVEFKPEHRRANPGTGEVVERWTYRNDLELKKFSSQKPITFQNEIDVLGFIYARDRHKYAMCRIYDNTKPPGHQILYEEVKGKPIYPVEPERLAKFNTWIKKLL